MFYIAIYKSAEKDDDDLIIGLRIWKRMASFRVFDFKEAGSMSYGWLVG